MTLWLIPGLHTSTSLLDLNFNNIWMSLKYEKLLRFIKKQTHLHFIKYIPILYGWVHHSLWLNLLVRVSIESCRLTSVMIHVIKTQQSWGRLIITFLQIIHILLRQISILSRPTLDYDDTCYIFKIKNYSTCLICYDDNFGWIQQFANPFFW